MNSNSFSNLYPTTHVHSTTYPTINQPVSKYTPPITSTTIASTSTLPKVSLFAMNTINNTDPTTANIMVKLSLGKINTNVSNNKHSINTNKPSSTVSSYSPYTPCTPITTITPYIPSQMNKPTGHLIILDFDDTIFPTSVLSTYVHNNKYMDTITA
eukprot:286304_1